MNTIQPISKEEAVRKMLESRKRFRELREKGIEPVSEAKKEHRRRYAERLRERKLEALKAEEAKKQTLRDRAAWARAARSKQLQEMKKLGIKPPYNKKRKPQDEVAQPAEVQPAVVQPATEEPIVKRKRRANVDPMRPNEGDQRGMMVPMRTMHIPVEAVDNATAVTRMLEASGIRSSKTLEGLFGQLVESQTTNGAEHHVNGDVDDDARFAKYVAACWRELHR